MRFHCAIVQLVQWRKTVFPKEHKLTELSHFESQIKIKNYQDQLDLFNFNFSLTLNVSNLSF